MSTSNINWNQYVTQWKPNGLNNESVNASGFSINQPVQLNTSLLHSAAVSASAASDDLLINEKSAQLRKCQDSTYVTPVEDWVKGDGFSIKETKSPKPNKATPNNQPTDGTSTLPPQSRGAICGTSVGVTNLDLSFNCNFASSISLDSCLFRFEKIINVQIKRLATYAWSLLLDAIPGVSYIQKLAKQICSILNMLQKIICFVQQLISCIMNTISAIINIIEWALSLPIQFIQRLITCIANFFSKIVGAFGSLTTSLTSVFSGLFSCKPFTCDPINNINDLTDISNVASDF